MKSAPEANSLPWAEWIRPRGVNQISIQLVLIIFSVSGYFVLQFFSVSGKHILSLNEN
jgi:hypothetical protein